MKLQTPSTSPPPSSAGTAEPRRVSSLQLLADPPVAVTPVVSIRAPRSKGEAGGLETSTPSTATFGPSTLVHRQTGTDRDGSPTSLSDPNVPIVAKKTPGKIHDKITDAVTQTRSEKHHVVAPPETHTTAAFRVLGIIAAWIVARVRLGRNRPGSTSPLFPNGYTVACIIGALTASLGLLALGRPAHNLIPGNIPAQPPTAAKVDVRAVAAELRRRFLSFVFILIGAFAVLVRRQSGTDCHVLATVLGAIVPILLEPVAVSKGKDRFQLGQLVFCRGSLFKNHAQGGRSGPAIILGIRGNQVIIAPMTTFGNKSIETVNYLSSVHRKYHLKLPCANDSAKDRSALSFQCGWTSNRRNSFLNCYWLHVVDVGDIDHWSDSRNSSNNNQQPGPVLTANSRERVLLTIYGATQERQGAQGALADLVLWSLCWGLHAYDMAAKNLLFAFPAAAAENTYPTITSGSEARL